jgi:predicted GIY-YIG superfamily endonuclease
VLSGPLVPKVGDNGTTYCGSTDGGAHDETTHSDGVTASATSGAGQQLALPALLTAIGALSAAAAFM